MIVAVVDTNVVVSGLLSRRASSPPARILHGMLAGRFSYLLSITLLAEYGEVLARPAIRRLHRLDSDDLDSLLVEIAVNGVVRELESPRRPESEIAPDGGDQHLWDLLGASPGALLVTGDRELRESPPRGRQVLSPAAFLGLVSTRL